MRFLATLPLLALGADPAAVEQPSVGHPSVELVRTKPSPRAELADSLEVLHAWDARRAHAWAESDPEALRALYVRGSEAGRADLQLLQAYRRHRVVVRRLVTQVFAVRVLHRGTRIIRLSVFDRVAGGELVHAGRRTTMRSSRPVTRTVVFRRVSGSWQVSRVSGSGRGPRAARP